MSAKIASSADGSNIFIGFSAENALRINAVTKLISGVPPYTIEGAGGGGGAVDSVNGQTGIVVLDAADVGAVPAATQSTWSSVPSPRGNVIGMLSWNNFGNGHVIFDASAGVQPNGAPCNNTNPSAGWSPSHPTLMGSNGTDTFGVRVDLARFAETATNASWADGAANLLNDGDVGILNRASTAWRLRVDTSNNLHVPGAIFAQGDVNGSSFQGSGAYMILNGAVNGETGGVVALNAPGFGTATQILARHVSGSWVGLQIDTPQLGGYRFDGGGFTSPGNVTAFSDARLKADWKEPVVDFVQRLAGFKAGTYLRTDSQIGLRQAGIVAQEVQALLPEAVINMGDNAFGAGDHTLGLNYGGFSAVAVVMLAREVMALRAEIEQLKGK